MPISTISRVVNWRPARIASASVMPSTNSSAMYGWPGVDAGVVDVTMFRMRQHPGALGLAQETHAVVLVRARCGFSSLTASVRSISGSCAL